MTSMTGLSYTVTCYEASYLHSDRYVGCTSLAARQLHYLSMLKIYIVATFCKCKLKFK